MGETPAVHMGIAFDHLSLAALAEGLGTCWIAGINEHKVKEILSVPDGVRASVAMVLGYPDESPDPRPRKSLEEIVCYDKYC
jgi:nitroreductase